jgi:Uma2 family endonuclease
MPASSESTLLTAEDLAQIRLPDKRTELVHGRLLVREPPSTEHGRIQANLAYFVTDRVRRNGLGVVFGQGTGFRIAFGPDTVLGTDLAFVSRERAAELPRRGYAALAPDFVAEILSPDDRPGEYLAKVAQWLEAGTRLVWVIDPACRARLPRGQELTIIGEDALLAGKPCSRALRARRGPALERTGADHVAALARSRGTEPRCVG